MVARQTFGHVTYPGKSTSAEADTPLLGDEDPLRLGRLFTPSANRPLKELPVLSVLSGPPSC